jgi:signal transduction histidine kinase/ligand-binding sensor domain-containing protein/ActR/RegA family two-component response regulator
MRTVAVLLLIAGCAQAQQYTFQAFGADEGLDNMSVDTTYQDRVGFLWVGTEGGLYRYDGRRFTKYSANEGLPFSWIDSIHETPSGELFVGGQRGLAQRIDERFQNVPIAPAKEVVGPQGIASDASGRLYVATDAGLAIGDRDLPGAPWHFRMVHNPPGDGVAGVNSVLIDPDGTVWFGCGQRICRLDHGGSTSVFGTIEGVPPDQWGALLRDRKGNLWARAVKHLIVLPKNANCFQAVAHAPDVQSLRLSSLSLDRSGNILIPSSLGLHVFTGSSWLLFDGSKGLPDTETSSAMTDREGNVWLGFGGTGLWRWKGYGAWESFTTRQGLPNNSIWGLALGGGKLWVGTLHGLALGVPSPNGWRWSTYPLGGNKFTRVFPSPGDGAIWFAPDAGILRRVDPVNGHMQQFDKRDGLPPGRATSVRVDRDGNVWATTLSGAYVRKRGSTRFENLGLISGTSPYCYATVQSANGDIWIACQNGLHRRMNGSWHRYTTQQGLRDDWLFQMVLTPDDHIYVAYREPKGVTEITPVEGDRIGLRHFSTADRLLADQVYFLGLDRAGRLWTGTDRGAAAWDGHNWHHFTQSNGLVWNDCNADGFALDGSDGSVWIGTSAGLSHYRPPAEWPPPAPAPVVLASVSLGSALVTGHRGVSVPYEQNSLSAAFSALAFGDPLAVEFRYRMIGLSNQWRKTTVREVQFAGIPPGSYTLQIEANSSPGAASAPATFEFTIRQPWWGTWTFRVLALLLTAGMGGGAWHFHTLREARVRRTLEAAVAERTQELAKERDRAQEASRLKGAFLTNVSHEIRTPLNGILGMSHLTLTSDLTPEQRDHIETIRESGTSLLNILNDILDLSKVEAGRMELAAVPFSIAELLESIARTLSAKARETGVRLSLDVSPGVPDAIVGDDVRLRQVLFNLVGNALKFTAAGEVSVAVKGVLQQDTTVELLFSVRDTGIGIPADKRALIFNAFQQADESTSRRFGGTGLGLAICAKLVALMGGRIWVEGAEGHGSIFYFTARFAKAAQGQTRTQGVAAPPSAAWAAAPAADPLRILVAEDNRVNQRVISAILEKRGHSVEVVVNGREAVSRASEAEFDLILMDVQMPEMDGIEATRRIRASETSHKRIPIAALTANAMKGDRDVCLDAGMDDFISKPFDPAEAMTIIERLAASRRQVVG